MGPMPPGYLLQTLDNLGRKPKSDPSGRHTTNHFEGLHILGDHGIGANHGTIADAYACGNHSTVTDPDIVTDVDRAVLSPRE